MVLGPKMRASNLPGQPTGPNPTVQNSEDCALCHAEFIADSPQPNVAALWDRPHGCQTVGILHPKRAIRNPLLELRPWIFDELFGDFGGPFCIVFTSWKLSGARISILESLTELSGSRESPGAHLGPNFRPCSSEV